MSNVHKPKIHESSLLLKDSPKDSRSLAIIKAKIFLKYVYSQDQTKIIECSFVSKNSQKNNIFHTQELKFRRVYLEFSDFNHRQHRPNILIKSTVAIYNDSTLKFKKSQLYILLTQNYTEKLEGRGGI